VVAVPDWVKMQLRDATQGRCAGCGEATGLDPHHRQPRGAGGTSEEDDIRNFLGLCRIDHDSVDAAPLLAQFIGWLVPRPYLPWEIPALIWTPQGRGWWLLTAPPHPRSKRGVLAFKPMAPRVAEKILTAMYGPPPAETVDAWSRLYGVG
jgi:hypothetical protein